MQWYYGVDGKQLGPVPDEEFFALAREGKLKPGDMVWNESMGEKWVKAETVPDLFATGTTGTAPEKNGTGGQTENRDLMSQARAALTGKWLTAVCVVFVYGAILVAVQAVPMVGGVAGLLIGGALMLGLVLFALDVARGKTPPFPRMFDGFKQFFLAFKAYLCTTLLTLAWMLLLIIPGIIASYRYALTFYIIADNPTIGAMDAIRQSKELMNGFKWKLFCLHCRFIGWSLLCVLTCGIGFLWVMPYMMVSAARFYDDLYGSKS